MHINDKLIVTSLVACMLLVIYLGYSSASLFRTTLSEVSISLLGVQDSKGVITKLFVEAIQGTGRIFVRLNDVPLQDADTQASIANAYEAVASSGYASALKNSDIMCSYFGDASYISGQSSGAPLAVAIMASVDGRKLRDDVLLTGNVDSNGNVKPVGGILEKAQAAKEYGAKIMLVPKGERVTSQPTEVCDSKKVGGSNITHCIITNVETDVGNVVNITVVEVSTVREAYQIMKS
jgi:uncharacterized protein